MEHSSAVADLILGLSALLLLASATLVVAGRLRLPFTVMLVVIGMLVAEFSHLLPHAAARILDFHIGPEVILFVFLPSLIFESAFHLDWRELRENLAPVLTLAVPGLLISTAVVGSLVALFTSVPLPAALVLGAILSATDPVAVIALFHQLGAPKRLLVLVEGESLFNDATAIVAAKILLAVAVAGYFTSATAAAAVGEFLVVFLGGIVVGWLMALAAGWALGAVHDNQAIEISILTTLAYLSFLVGEAVLHVSGVMATVAAGLTIGGWGRSKISPGIADYIEHFWAYVAFVANALIFLLVGLAIDLGALLAHLDVLLVTILAMALSRALVIYGLVPAVGRLPGSAPVGRAYQTVMYWGGLRGAVALAVVLSLGDFAWADVFTAVVMGAVLFTLLVQGLTIEPLMRRLGLDQPGVGDRLARDEARVEAALAAIGRIPELGAGGLFSHAIAERLAGETRKDVARLREDIDALRAVAVDEGEAERLLWLRCVATERGAYYELFSRHHIDERAFRSLDHAAAMRLDALRHGSLDADPFASRPESALRKAFRRLEERLPGTLGEALRTRDVAREYVKVWAEFQVCDRVTAALAEIAAAGTTPAPLVEKATAAYARRRAALRTRLDDWAAQFPEFVKAMQERLAGRLLLRVERDAIARQVDSGLVPHGLGGEALEDLDQRIRALAAVSHGELAVDPAELLRKVPFFADLAAKDVARVAEQLHPRTYAPGEDIIVAGESGTSMFFIARGVVRVLVPPKAEGGPETELATLLAGDFFGEMALLGDTPRSATCRATTACALQELSRAGVAAVVEVCPALADNLERAAAERSRAHPTTQPA
ncbi:MAG: cation:proton antiporter [Gammaproteobacteria bacterium]